MIGRMLALTLVAAVLATSVSRAAAAGANPIVDEMVTKGVAYLETVDHGQLGGKCLIGMAVFKHLGDKDHAKVQEAVAACRGVARPGAESASRQSIYSLGIAVIFLVEIDSSEYREDIRTLVEAIRMRQRDHGGFGYPDGNQHAPFGDTSMTQYAVLGLWAGTRSGAVEFPLEETEKVCNWLLRTQDPSGGWGYQGKDPGDFGRVEQDRVTLSLSAAGLGSTYICADLLQFTQPPPEKEETGLPPALQPVKEAKVHEPLTKVVEVRNIGRGITDGNRWFARNYDIENKSWQHYYMYALERYQSFKELAEGREIANPRWYEDGVRYLRANQAEDGSWAGQPDPQVATAFAVLFLLRSTKKTIEKTVSRLSEGVLTGGRGLPGDTTRVSVARGQVVALPAARDLAGLLELLESGDSAEQAALASMPLSASLSDKAEERSEQIARLGQLLRGGSVGTRRAAVGLLAASPRMDVAAELIAALTDADQEVVITARDGLRRLSRRFGGFGLPDSPTEEEKQSAQQAWAAWLRLVGPHGSR